MEKNIVKKLSENFDLVEHFVWDGKNQNSVRSTKQYFVAFSDNYVKEKYPHLQEKGNVVPGWDTQRSTEIGAVRVTIHAMQSRNNETVDDIADIDKRLEYLQALIEKENEKKARLENEIADWRQLIKELQAVEQSMGSK